MMLQETRITGPGVHKNTSWNGTELFLYNSGHQPTSYDEEKETLFYLRWRPDEQIYC